MRAPAKTARAYGKVKENIIPISAEEISPSAKDQPPPESAIRSSGGSPPWLRFVVDGGIFSVLQIRPMRGQICTLRVSYFAGCSEP
jgi:hypothetical protein